ncbi:hypothetical protein HXX76_000922 [Chlamydomonas incerta]|uniref:Calcineurin-like phosphoesterase domain-containing protein n=1 Tax=Chlamydomonas incerta TaxID=51695 RepID=A0A836B3M3_CHLIN|nr:hypothetical protein HXX76_000922 [Chlamydomonas incerta]|eukprot:KAG2446334.1 hypothetical protein HXX76_000922 [Chlamydomonas incerta]
MSPHPFPMGPHDAAPALSIASAAGASSTRASPFGRGAPAAPGPRSSTASLGGGVSLTVVSDLHLEARPLELDEVIEPGLTSDVLCLLGDIGDPSTDTYRSFLAQCAARFPTVLLLAGNNEYRNHHHSHHHAAHGAGGGGGGGGGSAATGTSAGGHHRKPSASGMPPPSLGTVAEDGGSKGTSASASATNTAASNVQPGRGDATPGADAAPHGHQGHQQQHGHHHHSRTMADTEALIRDAAAAAGPNVHFLQNSGHVVGHLAFLGATLWSHIPDTPLPEAEQVAAAAAALKARQEMQVQQAVGAALAAGKGLQAAAAAVTAADAARQQQKLPKPLQLVQAPPLVAAPGAAAAAPPPAATAAAPATAAVVAAAAPSGASPTAPSPFFSRAPALAGGSSGATAASPFSPRARAPAPAPASAAAGAGAAAGKPAGAALPRCTSMAAPAAAGKAAGPALPRCSTMAASPFKPVAPASSPAATPVVARKPTVYGSLPKGLGSGMHHDLPSAGDSGSSATGEAGCPYYAPAAAGGPNGGAAAAAGGCAAAGVSAGAARPVHGSVHPCVRRRLLLRRSVSLAALPPDAPCPSVTKVLEAAAMAVAATGSWRTEGSSDVSGDSSTGDSSGSETEASGTDSGSDAEGEAYDPMAPSSGRASSNGGAGSSPEDVAAAAKRSSLAAAAAASAAATAAAKAATAAAASLEASVAAKVAVAAAQGEEAAVDAHLMSLTPAPAPPLATSPPMTVPSKASSRGALSATGAAASPAAHHRSRRVSHSRAPADAGGIPPDELPPPPSTVREFIAATSLDYRRIRIDAPGRPHLTPDDTNALFAASVAWLTDAVAEARAAGLTPIVLTHHAPSLRGTSHPRFAGHPSTHAYGSDLEPLLAQLAGGGGAGAAAAAAGGAAAEAGQPGAGVEVWYCGHTHYNFDMHLAGGVRLTSNQFGSQPAPAAGYSRSWQHVLQPTERNAAWQQGARDTAALSFLSLPTATSSAYSIAASPAAQVRSLLTSPGGSGADSPAGAVLLPAPRSRGAVPSSSLLAAMFGRSAGGGAREAAAAGHNAPASGGGAHASGGGGLAAGVQSLVSSLLRPGVGGRSPASAASASTLRTSPNSAALRAGLAADAAAVAAALSAGGSLGHGHGQGQGHGGRAHGYGSSSSKSTSSQGSQLLAKSTAADEAAAAATHVPWLRHGAAGADGFFASALGDVGGSNGGGGGYASRPPRTPANGASPQDLAGLVGGL